VILLCISCDFHAICLEFSCYFALVSCGARKYSIGVIFAGKDEKNGRQRSQNGKSRLLILILF
jgi:hypothetical protein